MMYLSSTHGHDHDHVAPPPTSQQGTDTSHATSLLQAVVNVLKMCTQGCLWVAFLVISILYKETGITVLGLIFGTSFLNILSIFLKKLIPIELLKHPQKISFSKHVSWILFSLLMLVGYFVFRAVIVSPDQGTLSDFDISEKCDNRFNSMLAMIVSKCTYLFKRIGKSVNMLQHLLLAPIMSLRHVITTASSGDVDTASSTTSADISSFYLDDSALIRRAENPFAFLHGQEKVLSLLYLHFRYFFLMVWPVQLSPEYAFNCIPSVTSIEDEGNYRAVLAIVMYVFIAIAALYGYWRMILHGSFPQVGGGGSGLSGHAVLVSVMLMVIPFIPAAGVRASVKCVMNTICLF
jgi:hypothetical protein